MSLPAVIGAFFTEIGYFGAPSMTVGMIFASIFVGGLLAYADMGHWQGLTQSFAAYPWFSLFGRGVEDGLVSLDLRGSGAVCL